MTQLHRRLTDEEIKPLRLPTPKEVDAAEGRPGLTDDKWPDLATWIEQVWILSTGRPPAKRARCPDTPHPAGRRRRAGQTMSPNPFRGATQQPPGNDLRSAETTHV